MSVSLLPVPMEPHVWTRSTVFDASVLLVEQEPDAKSVNTLYFFHSHGHTHYHTDPLMLLIDASTEVKHGSSCVYVVIGVGKTCHYAGLQFPHGSHWEEECNSCRCTNGNVHCTKVRCPSGHLIWTLDT